VVAEEVVEAGGEATIWIASSLGAPGASARRDDVLQVAADYARLTTTKRNDEAPGQRKRTDARLLRNAPDSRARLLPPPERETAIQAWRTRELIEESVP